MRLIDADAEIEKMSEEMTRAMAEIARWEQRKTDADTTLYDIEAKIVQLQKNIVDCNKEIKILRLYNTAYDVDKVVGCIEAIKEKENGACDEEDCGYCKYFNTCCDGDMSDRFALDKAIEIVKGGGVEK